jgi:hypothetical protein
MLLVSCFAAVVTPNPGLRHQQPAPYLDRQQGKALPAGAQARMVPVYLPKGETFAEVPAGFGVSVSTV